MDTAVTTSVKDPVCDMEINPATAAGQSAISIEHVSASNYAE